VFGAWFMCQALLSTYQADTQCKRSIAHLLLAETYSAQSSNCHLLSMTIDISLALKDD
jgi:hypothetical protein